MPVIECSRCKAPLAERVRFCGECGAPVGGDTGAAPTEPLDPWLGRVVDGRYRVLGRIGAGGMGVVYRVEHLHLGKVAAMKVLAPETAEKPEMLRRFRVEAQAVSRLNHPNIVQTFDFGQADGAFYLVMEYVRGDDLAALLRRDGAWSFERAAKLFIQVCSGLTDAHDAGIVHRDLKPENLMVVKRRDGNEHVKVLDFGLAKLRERTDGAGVSSQGQVLGTPYYMSPEQVRGEPLDARADVYSLGATLYRVLTGEPPFDAPSPMGVLAKHITDDVVPPRKRAPMLPPDADRIVLRAMAKSPRDRFASAAEVQAELERTLAAPGRPSPSMAAVRPRGDIPAPAAQAPTVPTVPLDDSDVAGGGERLRRADVDDYEWSLRKRRLMWRLIIPGLILAAAGATGALVWRARTTKVDVAEKEPNNTPGYANTLTSGAPIRGRIAAAISAREGDVDFFQVPTIRGPQMLQARVEGVPGLDLVLELFDAQGKRLAKSDARGRGLGEWLQPTSLSVGESFIAVREVWIQGTPPTANARDAYTLTARWAPPQPGWEVEPNDSPESATPLTGERVRGYLGSADDRDWLSFTPSKTGLVLGALHVPAGVDVTVSREKDPKPLVTRRNAAGDEQFAVEGVEGKPVLLGIARRLDSKKDSKDQALEGLDDAYELVIDVTDK
jgi:eukaryotic-like serine/threonine-protein kinase